MAAQSSRCQALMKCMGDGCACHDHSTDWAHPWDCIMPPMAAVHACTRWESEPKDCLRIVMCMRGEPCKVSSRLARPGTCKGSSQRAREAPAARPATCCWFCRGMAISACADALGSSAPSLMPPPIHQLWIRWLGGDAGWTFEIRREARRCNRRIDQTNQTHLHTLPMARWSMVLMATLI